MARNFSRCGTAATCWRFNPLCSPYSMSAACHRFHVPTASRTQALITHKHVFTLTARYAHAHCATSSNRAHCIPRQLHHSNTQPLFNSNKLWNRSCQFYHNAPLQSNNTVLSPSANNSFSVPLLTPAQQQQLRAIQSLLDSLYVQLTEMQVKEAAGTEAAGTYQRDAALLKQAIRQIQELFLIVVVGVSHGCDKCYVQRAVHCCQQRVHRSSQRSSLLLLSQHCLLLGIQQWQECIHQCATR